MPVGDCENAFLEAARQDGVVLARYKKQWLNQRGHFGLPEQAASVVRPLHDLFLALAGDPEEQSLKRATALPGDFIHIGTGTIIEVDELQHFTSFRLRSFDHYPSKHPVRFEIAEYQDLCRRLSSTADKYRRTKAAAAFGMEGRRRQRAYYDALRDLAAPVMGHPPVIRVAAIDGDGRSAFQRNRERILHAVESI